MIAFSEEYPEHSVENTGINHLLLRRKNSKFLV
jgi:hypothetical protein